jgi:hypothetical protein
MVIAEVRLDLDEVKELIEQLIQAVTDGLLSEEEAIAVLVDELVESTVLVCEMKRS